VREVWQLVESVDDVLRVCEPGRDVSGIYGDDGAFSGFDEPAMFLKQLVGAAALGGIIVPDDLEQSDSAQRIAEGLADDGNPFFDRNDGLHA
jgi:hypothetical protein